MSDQSKPAKSTNPRIEAALREYFERIDRGEPVNREEFIARHSEVAHELRSFFAAEEPLRKAAVVKPSSESAALSTQSIAAQGQETVPPGSKPVKSAATKGGNPQRPFGRYRIIRTLGRGAMGTVYLAEDTQLERQVALKTPHFEDDPTGELVARFYREARAAANLRHANICPVYDVGEIEGKRYISMAYIEGSSLSALIHGDKPLSERQMLIAIHKLALALQNAHDHQIVHRDLKPANIMVDKKGVPIIMDFGLARTARKEGDASLTRSGMLLGSPAYMSPEQVEEESDRVGPASDQYSLGVILYEMLTGQLPFQGTVVNVLAQVITKDPRRPSELRPGIDPRVEAICLKMMAKQSADRFPSMKAVADEMATVLKSPATASTATDTLAALLAPPAVPDGSRAAGSSQILKSAKPKALTESDLTSLEELARKCLARRDYDQMIQIIERIPEDRRNSALQKLLEKARGKADEIAFLICEIDEADRLDDGQTALKKAEELLQIKPGHHRAREVQEKYSGYGRGGAARIGPVSQLTQYWGEGGWVPWSVLTFGLAVCAAMCGVMFFYLRGTWIVVDVQDPEIKVAVKGSEITIVGPKKEAVKVQPGNQELAIAYGDLNFTTKSFTLKKGETKTVTISVVDKGLVVKLSGETISLVPKEKASAAGPGPAGPGPGGAAQTGPASGKPMVTRPMVTRPVVTRPVVAKPGSNIRTDKTAVVAEPAPVPIPALVAPFDAAAAKKGQESWAARLKTPVQLTNSIGMNFILIPPGEFMMGLAASQVEPSRGLMRTNLSEADKQGIFDTEQPQHRVRITRAFYLGEFEVTRGQFAKFVSATGYKTEAERNTTRKNGVSRFNANWRNDRAQDDSHPVQAVSWNDAAAFCGWLSKENGKTYRLPTEAEWEYACRAGTVTLFYFGNNAEELTQFENVADATYRAAHQSTAGVDQQTVRSADGFVWSSPVGRFRPNPFGLYDMLGNVREWCQDWFVDDYYAHCPADDPPGPSGGTQRDPKGWEEQVSHGRLELSGRFGLAGNVKGALRVMRGGDRSPLVGPADYRTTSRSYITPAYWGVGVGFRVVCETSGQVQGPPQVATSAPAAGNGLDPTAATDRRAAQAILSLGGKVTIQVNSDLREFQPGQTLPNDAFFLRHIQLHDKPQLTDADLEPLEGIANLTEFGLSKAPKVTDAIIAHLRNSTRLQSFWFEDASVGDAGLAYIEHFTELKSLGLRNTHVTDNGLAHVKPLLRLEHLGLGGARITSAGLIHLQGLTQLRRLWLERTKVSDSGLVYLEHLPNLKILLLWHTHVTGAGLIHLKHLTQLEVLMLGGQKVTDSSLTSLQDLTSLKTLWLDSTRITDSGLAHLKHLTGLRELDLWDTRVTDAGIGRLQGLAELRRLTLGSTRITNSGMARLGSLAHLEWLDLRGTAIDAAGLQNLKGLTSLKRLDLSDTYVDAAAAQRLKQSLPDCEVIVKPKARGANSAGRRPRP